MKVRHEPAPGAQQRGLASAGPAGQHDELLLVDPQIDLPQGLRGPLGIAVGEPARVEDAVSHESATSLLHFVLAGVAFAVANQLGNAGSTILALALIFAGVIYAVLIVRRII